MKRLLFIILCCVALPSIASSQLFNWQYSARIPTDYPQLFVGVVGGSGRSFHIGNFASMEGPLTCAQYDGGADASTSFAIAGEWWQKGTTAYTARVGLETINGSFTSPFAYTTREGIINSEYELRSTLRILNIGAGIKQRLGRTFFFVGGDISGGFVLHATFAEREYIVSPPEASWANGLQSRSIGSGGLGGVQRVAVIISAEAGYDFSPTRDMYIVPSLRASFAPIPFIDTWQAFLLMPTLKIFIPLM